MNRASTWRTGLILALALPAILLLLDAAYGQRPIPGRPVPPRRPGPSVNRPQPPRGIVWITVWTCSRCRQEIGRGKNRPRVASCPRCGANFQTFALVEGQSAVEGESPAEKDASVSRIVLPVVLGLGGAGLVALVTVLVLQSGRHRGTPVLGASRSDRLEEVVPLQEEELSPPVQSRRIAPPSTAFQAEAPRAPASGEQSSYRRRTPADDFDKPPGSIPAS
jgi:hypothetical protein